MLYQRRGSGQSQFSTLLELDAKSDRIQMSLTYARENLNGDLSVEALAEAARLSPRRFSRVFMEEKPADPPKSPDIKPSEVAGKTPAEIDKIAKDAGLIPKGPNPQEEALP